MSHCIVLTALGRFSADECIREVSSSVREARAALRSHFCQRARLFSSQSTSLRVEALLPLHLITYKQL